MRHLVYNQRTGRIVSIYAHFDVASQTYLEASPQEVLDLTGGAISDQDHADGVSVITVQDAPANVAATHRVDVESQSLVPKYQLTVQAQRTQLNGDGADATDIQVGVADETGAAVDSFDGDLRAVTSRGKLSAPGGRIAAAGGAATFRLTATAETVARVRVTVSDPSGRCAAGSADLEFL
jgi:hypothetical protein